MSQDIWQRIELARERWDVLRHPFYRRWSAGELTREELARYSGQYRHAVSAIADLSLAAARAADREDAMAHATEEREHVALWDGFVDAAGGSREDAATPETAACVDAWSAPAELPVLLSRLYAIEGAQPAISRVKREGLLDLYGFGEGPATEYFRVHEGRDAEHAAEGRRALEELAGSYEEDELVAAAEAAFRANWRLLDGV